jgi:hypothetical protein
MIQVRWSFDKYRHQLREFGPGPGRLDRGGYQEGVIKGVRYRLL